MIKFFRKIRQKLLSEGKTGKYLKYAIGEIILVVVGILIALQINTWNEEKKERVQEQKYLNEIKENLESDLLQIENIRNTYQYISTKGDSILVFIKDAKPKTTNYNKLWENIIEFTYVPSFQSQKNGYNNLISAGNINQIKNQKLLREISTHYSNVEHYNELVRQTIYESSQWDIHPPIKDLMGKKEFLADLGYDFQTTSISEDDLSKNEKLISGLIYRKQWMEVGLRVTKLWSDSTNNLINIITNEINKKK
ncbi:DUF6090 family protein [Urechidicola vernalis]|uniref:DUF6090 family protein n=1 Tax=Urechidicola vernalis TaxID=3075600 RepID=A0ABU2Y7F1_9FLAO|nr:DUF6090 family protein [Urechidicola sp. P050]MDT0554121.1 DUF6090 family protein [Urechidicola sp. P050]